MSHVQRLAVMWMVALFSVLVATVFVWGVGPVVGFGLGVLLCVAFVQYDEEAHPHDRR